MLKACASSCTDFLMRHTNIASSRRPIYLYGFELLFVYVNISFVHSTCLCTIQRH